MTKFKDYEKQSSRLQNSPSVSQPEYEPPIEQNDFEIKSPKNFAAGIPAVIASMKHAIGEMGVVRSAKTLLKLNQKGGYDCSSCAWPDPDGDRNTAEFCENGAKAIADEATLSRATPEFFSKWSVVDLSQKSDYWLGKRGRITHPMVLRQGATHYEPITWTAVFEMIAKELNALSSPNEAIFYTSGRSSNESAFLYQLFVRQFGTNNLPDCSNMCHESSGSALTETIGVGKGTVKLEEVENAGVIFIIGQNPGTNHPRMLSTLEKAKRAGARIIAVNPLPEAGLLRFKNPQNIRGVIGAGTTLSDFFLQVRINGDVALLKGIMKQLLEDEDLRPTDWNAIVEGSGISREQIRDVAEVIASTDRLITCWAMGLTQHKNAVGTIQEIVNLHLMRGQIGKPGAGL